MANIINRSTNLNCNITEKDSKATNPLADVVVMRLNANLDTSNLNFNISATTVNATLASEFAVDVKAQYLKMK